ncbi:MAG: hypothetical protein ABIQ31_18575 [Ferruginibacter sp.]
MKQTLHVELGTTPTQSLLTLQKIKDAMVHAIFQKIASTGILDDQDHNFDVWQSIYLEADHLQASLLLPALAG